VNRYTYKITKLNTQHSTQHSALSTQHSALSTQQNRNNCWIARIKIFIQYQT